MAKGENGAAAGKDAKKNSDAATGKPASQAEGEVADDKLKKLEIKEGGNTPV